MMAGVVNHLWQSTVVVGLAWLMTLALRRNRAGVRHAVWLAASLKFLFPFAALVAVGSRLGWRVAPVAARSPITIVMDAASQPFSVAVRIAPAVPVSAFAGGSVILISLTALWFVGFVTVLLTWCVRWRRVAAVVRDGAPIESGLLVDTLRGLERRGGVRTPIALLSSSSAFEPGVFGIVRPVLLWPRRISDHLSNEQVEAILAHEVAHVRRRDNLTAALHMIVQAVFWFYPLVWWIGSRLVDERERACDEDVVRLGSEPQVYAESILKTCQFYVESPLACVAGVTGSDLKKRIEQIMKGNAVATLSTWKKALLATAAAAAVAAPVAVGLIHAPRLQAQSATGRDLAALEKDIKTRIDDLEQRRATTMALYKRLQASAAAETSPRPAFDVTSVKPNNSGEGRFALLGEPGGGLTATNVTLGMLIRAAYRLQDNQIVGGPKWLFSDRFDVTGKGSAPGSDGQSLQKLQALLADRFRIVTHLETRELPMYELVLARRDGKLGPKLAASTNNCTPPAPPSTGGRGDLPPPAVSEALPCRVMIGPGTIRAGGQSMAALAMTLSRFVGSLVVDRTGLAGNFDLTLEYAPDPGMAGRGDLPGAPPGAAPDRPASDSPSIFTAVQEQLGLKLDSTKGPVAVLVIDRAEKPTED